MDRSGSSMSNIISIEELRKEFLEKTKPKDVKECVEKQQELLEKFMRKCQELEEKLNHANEIISNMGSSLVVGNTNDEELICVQQIEMIKQASLKRELDINEVKKLDLLIKNLRLIRSQPTGVNDTTIRDVSETDLIALAKGD